MRNTLLLTAVIATGAGSAASAATTNFLGFLGVDQTWDRTEGIPLVDASENNTAYDILLFTFDADDPDVNFTVSTDFPQLDTTMYLFTDAWDVTDPLGATNAANVLQYNDDYNGILQSGIGSLNTAGTGNPADGSATQAVIAGQTYGLIVSSFYPASVTPIDGQFSSGAIYIDIVTSGNAVASLVPEPTSLGLLGLGGLLFCRRRPTAN